MAALTTTEEKTKFLWETLVTTTNEIVQKRARTLIDLLSGETQEEVARRYRLHQPRVSAWKCRFEREESPVWVALPSKGGRPRLLTEIETHAFVRECLEKKNRSGRLMTIDAVQTPRPLHESTKGRIMREHGWTFPNGGPAKVRK